MALQFSILRVTIDADYRGEIMVTLINHGMKEFIIEKGDRIAQGICALIVQLPGINVKNVKEVRAVLDLSGKISFFNFFPKPID